MSKAQDNANAVLELLADQVDGLSLWDIAQALNISPAAASKATKLLRTDPEFGQPLAVPCPKNDYRVVLDDPAAFFRGIANQSRHLATRAETMAAMTGKDYPSMDPFLVHSLKQQAKMTEVTAQSSAELAELLDDLASSVEAV